MKKAKWKRVAKKRINTLFNQAERATDRRLSDRYVQLARKLGMRLKVRIPRLLRRRFCRHCYVFLRPGVNMRVRIHRGKVIISCLSCKKFTRVPL